MLTLPVNYALQNARASKEPVFVFEILFAGGLHGTEGTNDVYFGTTDVSDVVNFPYPTKYYPLLDADSISSISHKVDPISGVSTIGSLTVKMQDYQNKISEIIKAADAAGHGLRRQRVEVYMTFKGEDWADKIKVRTLQVQDLRMSKYGEYTLTCSDIQRNLQKIVFNPYKTTISSNIAAAGAIAVVVPDNSIFYLVEHQSYGTVLFVKVNDEIMMGTSKTGTTDLNIPASGRGMFGTTAAAHTAGDEVQEIIVLRENPITMALKVMTSSGTPGQNGDYDRYPAHWGCSLDANVEVDISGWIRFGQDVAGLLTNTSGFSSGFSSGFGAPGPEQGYQFEFVFDKGIEAKKFIEGDILKILGGFGFVTGNGLYSAKPYNDLANTDKANAVLTINENVATDWSDLQYDYSEMANELWLEYVEQPRLSGTYIRQAVFVDEVSKKKWGDAKQLRYQVRGAIGTAAYVTTMYQRFQRIMARFSRPPLRQRIELLPRYHYLEVGDVIRNNLPIHDLLTGTDIDRAMEVISVTLKPKTGGVSIECIAQPERGAFWFNGVGDVARVTVSPASATVVTGATFQLTARAFDANGNQVAWPSISWTAAGNVTVSASGLVTAGAVGTGTVYATIGGVNSDPITVTVVAAPVAGTVASVSVSPAEVNLEVAATQVVTAQSFDASSVEITGKTYTWASSDPAVATVPAGPSASATITAVANGTTNITATETGSAVVSPNVLTTVAALPPATYTPPTLDDAVYQVGTQLDETDSRISGAPGGPYTFVTGSNFAAGDYWFDNDISLSAGDTITTNGNVRFFSLGDFTADGTIDAKGRGLAGGASRATHRYINAPGGFIWAVGDGFDGTGTGLTGRGGLGGNNKGDANAAGVQFNTSRQGGAVSNPQGVNVQIIPILPADGSIPWTEISGLLTNLQGSGGASGGSIYYGATGTSPSGAGGAGGGGLLIMARGIFVAGAGLIDLRGNDGATGSYVGGLSSACGGGGGGGGSFVALAERTASGITNMVVDANRVLRTGGAGGISTGWYIQSNGGPGGPGAFVAQVIG